MNVLTVVSPGLKVLFERVGKPEVINRPDFFRLGGTGAVIACNHVGWADSLWLAYAVYPRQLRYMSKQELFGPSLSRWVLEHVGSIPIDRADPSPSSIKAAVDILKHDGVIPIFPSGTRSDQNIAFKPPSSSSNHDYKRLEALRTPGRRVANKATRRLARHAGAMEF